MQLLRSNKNFSKKPVTQISVVPEDEILVTIREGCVSVHDISETNNDKSEREVKMTVFCLQTRL